MSKSWDEKEKARSEGRRKYFREYAKTRREYWKRRIFELLGNSCRGCLATDQRVLQIDHKNDDGETERKETNRSRDALYNLIRQNPKRYQLLCLNCNHIKRIERMRGGELPNE